MEPTSGRFAGDVAVRVVAVVAVCGVLAADPAAGSLAVPAILASTAGVRESGVAVLGLWLAGGAAVGAAVGWGIATLVEPGATLLGAGLGLAVGGGVGVVLRLVTGEEEAVGPPETVTFERDEPTAAAPGPQPVDLFDAHPDPILYYEASGEGPVVRAANDAFAETFGVAASAVENAGLGDALMAIRADDVVDAAAEGAAFDEVVECETGDGRVRFRLRGVAASDDAGTRGYVLYSPADAGG